MLASRTPATTEAAARRPPWALSVSVLQAGLGPRVPQVSQRQVLSWFCSGRLFIVLREKVDGRDVGWSNVCISDMSTLVGEGWVPPIVWWVV